MSWNWLYAMRRPDADALQVCLAGGAVAAGLLAALRDGAPPAALDPLWFSADGKHELRAAIVVGALARVQDEGQDFRAALPWRERLQGLLDLPEPALPQAARAGLLLHAAIAELLGPGDLRCVRAILFDLAQACERSGSRDLRVLHAAVAAYTYLLGGQLRCAQTLVAEALPHCGAPSALDVPAVHLRAVAGLLATLCGRPAEALAMLDELVGLPQFDELPNSAWMLAQGHRLVALCHLAPSEVVRAQAARIWQRPAPERNAYHRSYVYYAHGLAEWQAGRAEDALFHARMACTLGEACASEVAVRTPALLLIQALAQTGREAQAAAEAQRWLQRWSPSGARLLESAVQLELAGLHERAGRIEAARAALEAARAVLPADEALPVQHRSQAWVQGLQARLLPPAPGLPAHDGGRDQRPVQISCFGELCVRIDGRVLYDRDWHGSRSKTLLKALIVAGGRKVSAERLADLVWPDASGDRAQQNLKMALSRLRRLGAAPGQRVLPWLVTRHGQVSLAGSLCLVDALEFRQAMGRLPELEADALHAHLEGYVGDLLPQDNLPGLAALRDDLRRQFVRGAQALAQLDLQQPGQLRAEPLLERAIALAPADERSYLRLAELQQAAGHAGLAADTRDRCRAAMLSSGRQAPHSVPSSSTDPV